MLPKSPSLLKRKINQMEREGYLLDCWIAAYTPGGTAKGEHTYYQLRSRKPLKNGKRTQHLSAAEVPCYQQLVENGRFLKRLKRQLARVSRHSVSSREALTSSASDEWYTPPDIIALARTVLGNIDLDPASNATAQQWIQAEHHFTLKENGLEQVWNGRVWLNPPYGQQIGAWTEKAVSEYQQGRVRAALLLVRPAVGSAWYQSLSKEFPRCEPDKRIRFMDAHGVQQTSPVHGNAFFYLGKEVERFWKVFSGLGTVSVPIKEIT